MLIDLHGSGIENKGPVVLDLKGNLVWTDDSYGQHAMNVKVQQWKGDDYLTFWAGEEERGSYYMLDDGFNLAQEVTAVGEDVWGDPHEFKITAEDTALIIVYNRTCVDLSATYMDQAIRPDIVDAVIQEVDIESGELLFEWRASDHMGPDDGEYLKYTFDTHFDPKHLGNPNAFPETDVEPHDYFHMNSVDKDSAGNYLVSMRHTHQVICIDSETGDILWGLGGRANDFEDLSDGLATNFRWQHDARWIDEANGILGLFDNGIAENHWHDAPCSSGRILQLDIEHMTARLLHTYKSLEQTSSTSQGSFQYLPATTPQGHDTVFVGWGSYPGFSLFDAESEELLCETHYAASLFQYYEFAKSYRGIRAPPTWRARPEAWDPSAVIQGGDSGQVYVSWNGGMEVRWWVLQGTTAEGEVDEGGWDDVRMVHRDGFETRIDLGSEVEEKTYTTYRVAALDAAKNVLRYSNVVDPASTSSALSPSWMLVLFAAAAIMVITGSYLARQRLSRPMAMLRRPRRDGYDKVPSEEIALSPTGGSVDEFGE